MEEIFNYRNMTEPIDIEENECMLLLYPFFITWLTLNLVVCRSYCCKCFTEEK